MSNTWKQYGGIRKQEKFHNLNIGTLVADQVLLRESYAGKFKIPGSIYIGADTYTTGNVYTFTNTFTTFDNYVGKNLYVNKFLYFGTQTLILDGDVTHAYMYGDSSLNTIGINTSKPSHALDVQGINNGTDILSVSSNTSQVRNVLGKNINNRGISLNGTDTNTSLGFYLDTSLNYANKPDAQIKYTIGGNMYYVSTNNNINSSANTVITASGSTFISSQTLMNITAGQSTTITTKNTNLLSQVAISNRGQPTNIYNESTIIYDISNGLYLYDAYENTSAKAGSALTMVATDNSSNTFLRLITPNNAGLSLAAGTYPNDQTRTITSYGITDNTGKYRVNQTVVTGNSAVKYYATTGFNTYAPKTDNYIMDINGPTRIGNGEINKITEFNYEIIQTSFSKFVKPFGIAIGTPSPMIFDVGRGINVYPQYIFITNDGGFTWTPSRVDTHSDLETTSKNLNGYVYDTNYAMLGGSNSFFYYTLNGGQNWWLMDFKDPYYAVLVRNIVSIYIGEYSGNTKRVFVVYTLRGSLQMNINYFNIDFTTLPSINNFFVNNFSLLTPPIGMNTINTIDGFGDAVYFVGTGINKYQISTVTSLYLINTNQTYYDIQCYSANYVVAVGINIISYTYDGTNWNNIILSTTPVGNVTLRTLYLFDTNLAMAVGNDGVFLYTNDGAQTWSTVPNSILNTSGYASRINGSYNKLRHVFMNDINTMTIASVKAPYTVNVVNNNAVVTSGLTKLYSCYIPNLYNRANNKVFDVSGNMVISGDININEGGNLITNNNTFNFINNNTKTLNFAGEATTINFGNVISGNTYLRHNVDISGNVAMHKNVTVDNNLAAGGDLQIGGNSSVGGNLSVGNFLDVTNKAVFRGDIHVYGNVEHELDFKYMNRLYVEQDTYLYQRIFVGGDASLNGNVYIGGPLYIPTIITPRSNIITLVPGTPIQSSESLEVGTFVSYDSIFPAGTKIVSVSKIEPVYGHTLTYDGTNWIDSVTNTIVTTDILNGNTITLNNPPVSTFTNVATVNMAYQNSQVFNVFPDTSLNSRLYVGGDTSLNGRLSVSNDVSLNGNLMMYNSTSRMQLTPNTLTYNYSTNPSFPAYNTLPLSQFQYIQTLNQSVQEVLNTVTSKTGPIGIANNREFSGLSRDFTTDISNITSGLISDSQMVNPFMLGTNTMSTNSRALTLLTFDVANNNVLVAGNFIPTTSAAINFGTATLPYGSIYLYNQNAINFIGNNNGVVSQGGLSFNTTTGYLDISYNGITGSTVLSYGGNVAIGKAIPTTTLDVLGPALFNGNITQQTGNLYLNNRLFIASDISLAGNMYSNKNLYQLGDTILSSRLFCSGDISFNSNLFVVKDVSFNNRIFIGGDTSLNSNLYVAKTVNILGDISLNSRLNIRSDVSLNAGLYVANKTVLNGDLSLNGNIVTNGFTFLNNDEYLQGNLFITGNQYLNGNIIINGQTTQTADVAMNSRLFVAKDVSLNSKLYVAQQSIFNNYVQMNNNLFISNDLSMNGNLSIGGIRTTMNGDTSMNGSLSLQKSLFANGDVLFNGNLYINGRTTNAGDLSVSNRLFIVNDASFSSGLYVNKKLSVVGDTSLNGRVIVGGLLNGMGDINANSRLFVNGDSSLNGDLYVNGYTLLNNDISINGNIGVSNALIRSNIYAFGNTILYSDASLNANLIVGGNTVINGNISTTGTLFASNITNNGRFINIGDISANGNLNVKSNLTVNNNTNLNGNLNVSGTTNIGGALILASDLSINGKLSVGSYSVGSIPIGAIAGGAGLALGSFSNDVNIGKNFYVGGDTTLYGNLTVVQDLTLIGQLIIKQYTVNQTITTVSYEVLIAEDLSVNGRLFMMDDVSMNARLFVGKDVSLNANLYVGGRTRFAQPITIGNTLTINGNIIQNGPVTTNALSVFNSDVSLNARFFAFGDSNFINDVSMNTRLYVQNDTSLNSKLYVSGTTLLQSDVSMNNRLFVFNDTSLNANLYAKGRTILQGDVSMNSRLYVQNDTSLNGNLYTYGLTIHGADVSLNNRLYVQNDTNLFSRLIVQGQSILNNDVSMNYRLYVFKDVSINSNLFVNSRTNLNGDVSMNARLYVQNDTSLNGNFYTYGQTIHRGDVSLNSRLYVASDASIGGNFYVTGKTIHQNDVSFNKFLYGTDASYTGNVAIYGNLYLHTDLKFDNLYVKKTTTVLGNVYITGQSTQMVDASLNGNLNVQLDSSLNGRLAVAQDVSFNSNINVLLDSSLNGNLFVGIDTSLNGNLFVGNNVIMVGNSIHNGDVSMVSSLDLNGAMIARNNMNVYGIINQYNTVATSQNTIVNNSSYVTSNTTQIALGTNTLSQNIYVPGNIGIGTNNPLAPLYVNKSTMSTGQADGYYFDTNGTITNNSTRFPYSYSIYAINSIATSDKIIASSAIYFSDERIKTNIENIDGSHALESIRKLEPKKYNYIDTIGKGTEPTLGFVAQQVKNVLEYAVSTSKNFIPDIYELCEVVDKNTIRLTKKTTDILKVEGSLKAMSINQSELIFTIKEIIDEKTFTIKETIETENIRNQKIFIYGQEINDFNNLDKNVLFTITTAALKQVDKELQDTKTTVQNQKTKIERLEEQMKIINAKLQFF
jgi:predicted acyltransferase (DUF342 family)